jgi:hypothetical protein
MVTTSRNYAGNTRGRPFTPGNPGRPHGARNKATVAIEDLLEGEAERLGRKAIDMALAGDSTALRLCLDRIAPVRRGRPIRLPLPDIVTVTDVSAAQTAVVAAMARGEITTDEASDVTRVLAALGTAIERRELEARIAALEAREPKP